MKTKHDFVELEVKGTEHGESHSEILHQFLIRVDDILRRQEIYNYFSDTNGASGGRQCWCI